MRLKTFTAGNVTEGLAQIRAVLGDEAVIVATQEDEAGGVRITAAVEGAEAASPATAPSGPAPVVDIVYQGFRRHGVPAVIGEALLELVGSFETGDPVTALAAALRQTFRFKPLEKRCPRQAKMLIGPPGAGKTLALAKLAARALTAGQRMALFTTDSARAGGDARLASLAAALGQTAMTVEHPRTLADGLRGVEGMDWLLVDSAGANHLDVEEMGALGRYLLCADIEPILVVPAGIDPVEAGDIGMVFAELGASRVILTRLDLTRRLGSIFAAAHAAKLAFAEIGTGARVKDGLIPADATALARFLLPGRPAALQKTGT